MQANRPAGTPPKGFFISFGKGALKSRAFVAWCHYYGEYPVSKVYHSDGDQFNDRISNLTLIKPTSVTTQRKTPCQTQPTP